MSRTGPVSWGARVSVLAVLFGVATVGVARLDREVAFYDEGIYVANGKALALGRGYVNLSLPDEPPQGKYPPLFPGLLSVVWWASPEFPRNLLFMKGLVLAMALGFLVLSERYVRAVLGFGPFESALIVTLTGVSPLFMSYAAWATSDIPFAFLSLWALWWYERHAERRGFAGVLLVAVLAFFTRTAGVCLLVTVVIHSLVRRRVRDAIVGGSVSAMVVCGWLLWSHSARQFYAAYPPEVRANYIGYLGSLTFDWVLRSSAVFVLNLKLLIFAWAGFLAPWAPVVLAPLVFLPAYLFLRGRRFRMGGAGLFCALYVAMLLVIPYPDTARYCLPVAPLLVAYGIGGLQQLGLEVGRALGMGGARLAWRWSWRILAGVTVLTNLTAAWPSAARAGQEHYRGFHRMLDWIGRHVPEDAVVVGAYDPAYYLFTGRKAIRVSVQDNFRVYYTDTVSVDVTRGAALARSFREVRACYLIRDPMIGGREYVYFGYLIEAIKNGGEAPLEIVYASADRQFVVYRWPDCS